MNAYNKWLLNLTFSTFFKVEVNLLFQTNGKTFWAESYNVIDYYVDNHTSYITTFENKNMILDSSAPCLPCLQG